MPSCAVESRRFGPIPADSQPSTFHFQPAQRPGPSPTNSPNKTMRQLADDSDRRLQLARLKVLAGTLGLTLGMLTQRDKAYQLEKARRRARTLVAWLTLSMILAAAAVSLRGCNEQKRSGSVIWPWDAARSSGRMWNG